MMISPSPGIRIPAPVEEKLNEVRQARDRAHLSLLAAIGLLALLAAMSLAMLVDWMVTLFDPFWRSVLTGAALAGVGVTLIAAAALLWRRGRQLTVIAREVDRAVPRIEERWWTVAELAAAPLEQQRAIHVGMLNRLSRESTKWEVHVAADEVVSLKGTWSVVLVSCAVVLGLLLACVWDWPQTSVLMKRFWAPTANISVTRLVVPARGMVVARGEPFVLEARQEGRFVDEAVLFLRDGDSPVEEVVRLAASGPEKDRFVHRIKAADESMRFRMRAGDGQSPWVNVTVARRPELAAVRFRAVPPAYTGREPVVLNELPDRIRIVEGSMLEIALLPQGEVQQVELRFDDETRQRLIAGADGWRYFRTRVNESLTFAAVLTETHGLVNKRPPVCRVEVYRDAPPQVRIASPSEDMAARPDEEIEIEFTAEDDFGISRAELVIYGDAPNGTKDEELRVIDIPLAEQFGTSTVNARAPLDLKQFQLHDGQSISVAVRVYDTRQAATSADRIETLRAPEEQLLPPVAQSTEVPLVDSVPAPVGQKGTSPTTPAAEPATTSDRAPMPQSLASLNAAASAETSPSRRVPPPSSAEQSEPNEPRRSDSRTPADVTQSATPPARTPTAAGLDGQSASPAQPAPADRSTTKAPNQPPPAAPAHAPNPPSSPPLSSGERSTATASVTSPSASATKMPPGSNPPDDGSLQTGAPRPPNEMTQRTLDVAQSASSSRMRLNIDQWAGSFAGRQREKLEMMISPRLEDLDELLSRAENRLKELLDGFERDLAWTGGQDRILGQAEGDLAGAMRVVAELQTKSQGTPYAFIGLQLSEIADSHIVPAGESAWLARQAQDNAARRPPVETAWQQTGRARQRLAQLVTQYERVRREHHLTDAIEQIKTMYQAFLEDSFQLLDQQKSPINSYQRRIAQLELDEEYLKRLEEVLRMRQKLLAEFARILSEDPRLLRRFVDSINRQSETLRDQLTLLAMRQQELDMELRTWSKLSPAERNRASALIIQKRLQQSSHIAEQTALLQERFHTWSPLDLGLQDEDVSGAVDELAKLAAKARQLEAKAAAWRPPAQSSAAAQPAAGAGESSIANGAPLPEVISAGRELYDQLRGFDERLLELSGRGESPELAAFLVRRLAENRSLIARTSGWVFQLEHLDDDNYPGAAAVDQQQLAEETNVLTADLADLEQQLIGLLGREDNTLPADIAELSRRLFKTLDGEVAGGQLGAVFSLQRNRVPVAIERTQAAVVGFQQAEELFDQLIKRVIEQADKLPVQDPIADLLDDPTLDELLGLLESERDLAAALGIPPRPTNLQIMGDWLRRGLGGGGGIGGNMIMAQLNRQQQMLNRAARRAADRTNAETDNASKRRAPRRIDEWNVLASQLEERLLQGRGQLPPERYRRAIEQYFEQLSRRSADDEAQSP